MSLGAVPQAESPPQHEPPQGPPIPVTELRSQSLPAVRRGLPETAQVASPAMMCLLAELSSRLEAPAGGVQGRTAEVALAKALYQPLAEFMARPSKQFRGRMVEAGWQLAGGQGSLPQQLGALVEALHAGSLIIDDIEDESVERRGAPALHLIHGVPVALNAGNWLYFWALSLLQQSGLDAHAELSLSRLIASTLLDCHRGQALDVSVKITELEQSAVHGIVEATTRLKTGRLMGLSAAIGATVGGASGAQLAAITTFATELGVALQMLDDQSSILAPKRGQKAQEDLRGLRCTWPWAWLAERRDSATFQRLQTLAQDVAQGKRETECLRIELAAAMGGTIRNIASQRLRSIFTELQRALGPSAALRSLRAEIARLEASYG
jgi:geranylgeranyl pyrophosphate synthase